MTEDVLARLREALQDRYRIERELGAGGMATVYLSHDARHDRKVAVKVLRPELAAALGAERFLREIKITARLNHPHILPLLDSGEANGDLFYVMPYVEGESLRDRLNREQRLPIEHALDLFGQFRNGVSKFRFGVSKFRFAVSKFKRQVLGKPKSPPYADLMCVFVSLGKEYGSDRFSVFSWRDLQRIVIPGYQGYLKKHDGIRPKNPKSPHTAVGPGSLAAYENNWLAIERKLLAQ